MEQLAFKGSWAKAMSSYRNVVKEIVEHSATDRLPCRFCGKPTLRETLSQYGARCFECFTAIAVVQHFPDVGDKRIDGPRGWAHALKRRHEQGDRLTPAQVSAYKAALRTTEEA
jgi:hypothetical protein